MGRMEKLAAMHSQSAERERRGRDTWSQESEDLGLPPARYLYKGRNYRNDSILALYLGTFRKPTAACELYIYELPSIGGYKIGIDSTGTRASNSQGVYGDKLVSFSGLRRDMWLLEQAMLRALPSEPDHSGLWVLPPEWAGHTEIRFGDPVELIGLAAALRSELEESGWCEFAISHVCVGLDERAMCRALDREAQATASSGDQQLDLL